MSRRFDRFLQHLPTMSSRAALGRVFNVTQESWKLTDDPSKVRPRRERLITGHTASEAADFARFTASAFSEHGFHKPSGAWWASDGANFYRFVVHTGTRGPATAIAVASGLGALAFTLFQLQRRSARRPRPEAAAKAAGNEEQR